MSNAYDNTRVLARDRRTGKLVLFHVLPDGRYVVETQYDVEDIIANCAEIRNAQPDGWKGDTHMVAQIPMPMHQQMRNEGRIQDEKDFKKWLNDSDYSQFRTKRGRI